MSDLAKSMAESQAEEDAAREAARAATDDYTGDSCQACGRVRVFLRVDGQLQCEKCERIQDGPVNAGVVGAGAPTPPNEFSLGLDALRKPGRWVTDDEWNDEQRKKAKAMMELMHQIDDAEGQRDAALASLNELARQHDAVCDTLKAIAANADEVEYWARVAECSVAPDPKAIRALAAALRAAQGAR